MQKRKKLNQLLIVLKEKYKEDIKRFEMAKNDADEIARVSANSPSQSGDRIHSQGQADIAMAKVERTKLLINELKDALDDEVSMVVPPCFIELRQESGVLEMFLVKNIVETLGYKMVSDESSLGSALLGKRETDKVKINETEFEITMIE